MRSYGTTERTEDNKQTTVSAQKNAIFSSQRFHGLEKKFREETQLYALRRVLSLPFNRKLSEMSYGRLKNSNNLKA